MPSVHELSKVLKWCVIFSLATIIFFRDILPPDYWSRDQFIKAFFIELFVVIFNDLLRVIAEVDSGRGQLVAVGTDAGGRHSRPVPRPV